MAQTPGEDKHEPTLELPKLRLPGLRRRRSPEEALGDAADRTGEGDQQPGGQAREQPPATPESQPESQTQAEPESQPESQSQVTGGFGPRVPGRPAAAVTGLVVGAAGAAATHGAAAGCEYLRGVSSCGGAPGFFVLVAILAVMTLAGQVLLRVFRVQDPGSTSFLAVGIVAVGTMLLLLEVIFSPWMFAVVPGISAGAFLLAHWVTTRFDHEDTGRRDWS